jgi:hypothetical protein
LNCLWVLHHINHKTINTQKIVQLSQFDHFLSENRWRRAILLWDCLIEDLNELLTIGGRFRPVKSAFPGSLSMPPVPIWSVCPQELER